VLSSSLPTILAFFRYPGVALFRPSRVSIRPYPHLARSAAPQSYQMFHDMSVMFLGTGSGGGPSNSRNCSSLVMDVVGDGSLWMVDCAEGTTRQFEQQPYYGAQRYKRGRLTNIFITHMHADHTMGIIGLLKNLLAFPKPNTTPVTFIFLFSPRPYNAHMSFINNLYCFDFCYSPSKYNYLDRRVYAISFVRFLV